jgi:DtxR family Mn-dependent transcriptional regulator
MPEIELTEASEEVLSSLAVAEEEQDDKWVPPNGVDASPDDPALHDLLEAGLIEQGSEGFSLTAAGRRQAASVLRRERLAERLLADVLHVSDDLATETACKFEHLLRKGLDDQVCTLLGHPRFCPHGSPNPPGDCCRAGSRAAQTVVSSLADLSPGESGVIAYLQTPRRDILQRMLAMGAIPGTPVVIRQRFPSFVFDLGQSQVAVDRETAQQIYVRLTASSSAPSPKPPWFARPFRGFRSRRRGRRP